MVTKIYFETWPSIVPEAVNLGTGSDEVFHKFDKVHRGKYNDQGGIVEKHSRGWEIGLQTSSFSIPEELRPPETRIFIRTHSNDAAPKRR